MKKFQNNSNIIALIGFVVVAAVIRFLNVSTLNDTEFAQFSPLMASCLFIGSYVKNSTKVAIITLATLLVSDLIIQNVFYKGQYGVLYSGWYWMYPLFIGAAFLGKYVISKVTVSRVVLSSVAAAVIYFLISNFIVWIGGGSDARTAFTTPLAKNWDGLTQCYYQAIPFFKNNLEATLVYSGVFFGAYELLKVKMPSLAKAK